jgi:siroheme synthase
MGATTARAIADELLVAGLRHDHPVAAVHRAGAIGEELAVLTLGVLATRGCPFPSPTVLVIGGVAARGRTVVNGARDRPCARAGT